MRLNLDIAGAERLGRPPATATNPNKQTPFGWRRPLESLNEMHKLIQEIAEHLQAGTRADRRKAIDKLRRIASTATTLSLTLERQDR